MAIKLPNIDWETHLKPGNLERCAFYWLWGLLLVSALALLVGVNQPHPKFFRPLYWPMQELAWLLSGIAAVYLVYRWQQADRQLFPDGKIHFVNKDKLAFWLMILTGLNVGLTSVIGHNIFLSLFWDRLIHGVVMIACLAAAYHLHLRYHAVGSLFAQKNRADTQSAP